MHPQLEDFFHLNAKSSDAELRAPPTTPCPLSSVAIVGSPRLDVTARDKSKRAGTSASPFFAALKYLVDRNNLSQMFGSQGLGRAKLRPH